MECMFHDGAAYSRPSVSKNAVPLQNIPAGCKSFIAM